MADWVVTCSCGWTRECSSRWAVESVTKLHPRLSAPGTQHTIAIEEPPADAPPGTQLPLIWRGHTRATGWLPRRPAFRPRRGAECADSLTRAEATHQVVRVPSGAVALADRLELVLSVGRRDGCTGYAAGEARRCASTEEYRPAPRERPDGPDPWCGWYTARQNEISSSPHQ